MRNVFMAILCLLSLAGCKKETPPAPAVSANTEMLASKPWLYNEYYKDYGKATQKRMYKRNNPGNTVDFSEYQYQFKKDGSFIVTIGTETLNGSWKFLNNETQIEISSDNGTPTLLTIQTLNSNSFDWEMNEYYAMMIPNR